MNSIAKRLYIVAAIIVATWGISRLLQAETESPETEMPEWTFRDLPLHFGDWRGEDHASDPKLVAAANATKVVDRIYRSEPGRAVSMYGAMFMDPADGVYHSPLNCYLTNGWKKLNETREKVTISKDMTITVALTTWEKDNEKIMVLFWYQLGDYVLHSRLDLGGIRWSLRGQSPWPVLMKVMLQATVTTDAEDTKKTIVDFAEQVAQWLNQPAHQKYLGRWRGV
jgi:EpsI family protein